MKDRLFEALKKGRADYVEIRVEMEETTHLAYRGREVESAGSSTFGGGIARACTKGGWGMLAFDSLKHLEEQVEEACRCAAFVGHDVKRSAKEKTELAEVEIVDAERPAKLKRDPRGVSLDEKLRLIQGYNDIILGADPSIESSRVTYGDSFRTVYFANTRGTYYMEERPRVYCAFHATARDGSLVQRAGDSFASAVTYDVVVGLEEKVREVAERAASLLKAPKVEGGPQTVILNHQMGGVFIHEAFGHLSEADFLYENPRMRNLMVVGREMGVKNLNVVDDGSIDRTIGSLSYDDEGTPTSKTYLIKQGVLTGHLHSLETAAKMGAKPTGNARSVGRRFSPIVRMTNTYIENGDMSVEELFAGVDNGIYACDAFGGQTEFEMFTFSAGYGYRIENGKIGELVRDVILTGNVFQTLKAIDGMANDLKICEGAGGCGKSGQAPLPVGFGSPHIRIRDVVIGGERK
ncbi:MAG: TldD/PmbA family protein [Desulfobacterales bacterium]|nr:TldD/PmbA family protein [Desulfobacterales bacterium]